MPMRTALLRRYHGDRARWCRSGRVDPPPRGSSRQTLAARRARRRERTVPRGEDDALGGSHCRHGRSFPEVPGASATASASGGWKVAILSGNTDPGSPRRLAVRRSASSVDLVRHGLRDRGSYKPDLHALERLLRAFDGLRASVSCTSRPRCSTTSCLAHRARAPRAVWIQPSRRDLATFPAPPSCRTFAALPMSWTGWFPSSMSGVDELRSDEDFDEKKIEEGVRLILEGIGEDPDRGGLRRRRLASPGCIGRSSRASAPMPPGSSRSWRAPTTTRWSWSGTSRCSASASTTSCRSSGGPTSPTSRTRTDGSPACQDRPRGGRLLESAAGAGAAHHPDRRGPRPRARAPRGVRGDRGRAPLHDDAGRQKPGALTVTSAVRGLFRTDARTRQEAMQPHRHALSGTAGRYDDSDDRRPSGDAASTKLRRVGRARSWVGVRERDAGLPLSDGGLAPRSGDRRGPRARASADEGADVLDVGGESDAPRRRPGHAPGTRPRPRGPGDRGRRGEAPRRPRLPSTRGSPRSPSPRSLAGAAIVNDVAAGLGSPACSTWCATRVPAWS